MLEDKIVKERKLICLDVTEKAVSDEDYYVCEVQCDWERLGISRDKMAEMINEYNVTSLIEGESNGRKFCVEQGTDS